jgi:hypothetical protein
MLFYMANNRKRRLRSLAEELLCVFLILVLALFVVGNRANAQDVNGGKCPDARTLEGRMCHAEQDDAAESRDRDSIPHRPISVAEQRRIIAYFDTILVDGPSARWRWGKVVRGSIACFWVNSKNRMGGYSGWSQYTFDLKTGQEQSFDELRALLARLNMPDTVNDICA